MNQTADLAVEVIWRNGLLRTTCGCRAWLSSVTGAAAGHLTEADQAVLRRVLDDECRRRIRKRSRLASLYSPQTDLLVLRDGS